MNCDFIRLFRDDDVMILEYNDLAFFMLSNACTRTLEHHLPALCFSSVLTPVMSTVRIFLQHNKLSVFVKMPIERDSFNDSHALHNCKAD